MAVLLYLHRFCFSFMERYIKEDLRLSDTQTAWLLSAFFWAYALGQVPAGSLSDRRGARVVLAVYILLWSLCTGLIGAATAFVMVLVLRFGCGLAQAGAYPTSAALLTAWVPFRRRGLASSIVSNGGRIGGALAPLLTAYLIVAFVPVRTSPLLGPEDLLDAHRLAADLCGTSDPSTDLGARILGLFPESRRQMIHDVAATPQGTPLSDAQTQALLGGLNAALRQPDLVRPTDLEAVPLPREALDLARRPPGQRSEVETERLNRLLLEAAFPAAVKKLYGQGWRPVLGVYGAAGVLVAGLFWLCFRNQPEQHPYCNEAEVRLIESDQPARAPGPVGSLAFGPLLRNRSLWLCSAAQAGTNFGWIFLLTWLPRYLVEVHQVPVLERGWMASVPLIVGMCGQLAGGWITDALTASLGRRWGRCLPMALSRFVAMAAFLLCLVLASPWQVTAALAMVALATDLGTPSVWAYSQDVGGRHIGAVLGWGNMWGSLGAALSPLVLNAVVLHWGWPAVFLTCAAAFLLAGITALGVDATMPVFPIEKPETRKG
jgi:sugar phosphate permease